MNRLEENISQKVEDRVIDGFDKDKLRRVKWFLLSSYYYPLYLEKMIDAVNSYAEKIELPRGKVYKTSGALELPQSTEHAFKTAEKKGFKYDFGVILGIVLQGDSKHNVFILQSVYNHILSISIAHNTPIGVGIISADTLEILEHRTKKDANNYGYIALRNALSAHLYQCIGTA
jgi:6,7-dimethyl-8-ribityllumazine synthase